jgi:hypothetical protein
MASKLIRWAGAAAAAIVALILLLLAVAHLPSVRARVLERARAYATRDLGIVLDADALDYSLTSRAASLRNVTIAATGQPALIRADSARVVLSRRLFRGVIEIENVELVRPRITIVRHADGTTNLPVSRESESQTSTPLELGTIDIRQLEFALDDRLAHRTVDAGPIDLRLDSSRTNPRPGSFGPSPFTIQFGQTNRAGPAEAASEGAPRRRLTLAGTLAGRLAFDGARLSAPELRIEAPEGRVALEGWADLIAERPLVEARGQLALDLARARRFAGAAAESLAGSFEGSIHASGPLVDPALRLTLEGRDLAYRSFTGVRLSAAGTYGGGRLDVQRLQLRSRLGELDASGTLTDTSAGRITANWRAVDLDRVVAAAGLKLPAPLGSSATGQLSATLNAADLSGSDWPRQIDATGSMRLVPGGDGLSLSGAADFTIRSGAWSLKHSLASQTGRVSLDGLVAGRLTPDAADSTLSRGTRLRADDLSAILPILRQAGVSLPIAFESNTAGRATADILLAGMATRPLVSATIAARGLQADRIPATDVDAKLTIDRQSVRASTIEARTEIVRLTASGQYHWSGKFDGRFEGSTQNLDQLMRSFDVSGVTLTGTARLSGTFGGSTESPRAQATLAATGVTVDDTPVGALNGSLTFADNQLNVQAEAPEIAVRANGRLDSREPYAYQAEAAFDRTPIAPLIPARLRDRVKIDDGTSERQCRRTRRARSAARERTSASTYASTARSRMSRHSRRRICPKCRSTQTGRSASTCRLAGRWRRRNRRAPARSAPAALRMAICRRRPTSRSTPASSRTACSLTRSPRPGNRPCSPRKPICL